MAIDRSSIKTLLSVNGITEQSTEQEIRNILTLANYSEADLKEYFAGPVTSSVPVAPLDTTVATYQMASSVQMSTLVSSVPSEQTVAKPPLWAKITSVLLTILLLGGSALVGIKTYKNVQFIYQSVKGSPSGFGPLTSMIGIGLLAAVIMFFISWGIARLLYRTRSRSLWFNLVTGIYVIIWFLLVYILPGPILKRIPTFEDSGFIISLILGFIVAFFNIFFLSGIILIGILSYFVWNKGKSSEKKGVIASLIVGVVGVLILIYTTGAFQYPAKAFHIPQLCYAVTSELEKVSCLNSAFVVRANTESGEFDQVETSFNNPHAFAMIGGKLVFAANSSKTLLSSEQVYVDGVQISDPARRVSSGPVDAGDGRIAYVESTFTRDNLQDTLYIDGKAEVSDKSIVILNYIPGFVYVVYGKDRNIVSENGKIVVNGTADDVRAYVRTHSDQQRNAQQIKPVYDAGGQSIQYTVGNITIVEKKDGVYVNGSPLVLGTSIGQPSIVDNKLIFGTYGFGTNQKSYLFIQKGLVSKEVLTKLGAK